jgi:hypothetical protein
MPLYGYLTLILSDIRPDDIQDLSLA